MKKLLLLSWLFFSLQNLFSQNYFQQEVNYKINVTLDDRNHTLTGDIEIVYTNNSPQPLDSLYFHLWANAFSKPTTAYAQQEVRLGSTKFYFSDGKDLGGYSGLDFSVDGEKAQLRLELANPDIAVLKLPKTLQSGAKVTIRTPFTLKIPASFSRLGHVGTSYQMTQWYPKPAVLDHKGWHPMPYLDMGEFYSEFGSFDVSITLPENYVVGATGVLQTQRERDFLMKKTEETQERIRTGFPKDDSFPASSPAMKTIRYTAEKVHDFAWFADKRFNVQKGEVTLPSGRKVDTWTMFTDEQADLWTKSIQYVNQAVQFYSEHVGEYPWPHATAVHSALSAGGGMEYPMITVIGNSGNAKDLDIVIAHEVGHNWFYGLLAFNEHDHAWMDEGINSYYEYRYTYNYYGDRVPEQVPNFIKKGTDVDLYEAAYLFQARRRLDQAPETPSNEFSGINYGLGAYVKPGSAFIHLENYLGVEHLDAIMQSYYEQWKFRHPYPEDLRSHVEKESGKDLSWFFDGYIGSNKRLDYALKSVSKKGENFKILVENKGEIAAPFPISGLQYGEWVETNWFEGFEGEQEVTFPNCDCDEFILDLEHLTLEVFRKNNNVKTGGLFKKSEPLQLKLLGGIEYSRRSTLYFLPLLGWNKYDGVMAGMAFYNRVFPAKKLEFAFAPMYGISSNDLNGLTGLKYNIFPKSEKIRQVTFGLSAKAFNYRETDSLRTETGFEGTHLQYRRLVPFVRVDLMKSHTSKFYQTIQLRSILLDEERTVFRTDSTGSFYSGNDWEGSVINELSWELGNRRALNPYSFRVTLEQQRYEDPFTPDTMRTYLKASLELKAAYTYGQGRNFYFRLFFGGFLKNERKERGYAYPGAFNLTSQGFNDYRYDDFYFGRTEQTGLFSQQIMLKEGGMKVPLGSPFSEGRSRDFILVVNLKADLPQELPGSLPIKPYFDIGYYSDARTISAGLDFDDQLWWQGGFALEFLNETVGIYFPVINSRNLRGGDKLAGLYDASGRDKFWERITFTMDFAKLNPWGLVDGISF